MIMPNLPEQRRTHETLDLTWLEHDTDEVRRFIREQSARTEAHLQGLPLRSYFRQRAKELLSLPRHDLVARVGAWVYALEIGGPRHGSLVRARSVDELGSGSTTVYQVVARRPDLSIMAWSPCGVEGLIACLVSTRGSVIHEVHVVNTTTGELVDLIRGVRGTVTYCPEGTSSVVYLGLPSSSTGEPGDEPAVWRHEIGTEQAADVPLHLPRNSSERDSRSLRLLGGGEGWVVLARDTGPKSPNDVQVLDLNHPWRDPFTVATAASGHHRLIGILNGAIYLITNDQADRNRVVAVDLKSGTSREIVPEDPGRMLLRGVMTRTRLALKYTRDGAQYLVLVHLDSGRSEQVELGEHTSIAYVGADPHRDEVFVVHSSVGAPPACLSLPPGSATKRPASPTRTVARRLPLRFTQLQAKSPDGTLVPVFLATRGDRPQRPRPLLLYAYGGFGVALRPGYSPMFYPWLEAGGAFAIAHVRGGGERGASWHQAAIRHGRHRAFADLYAVAETLVSEGITTPQQMVLHGRSNGGLLAAVAMLQRPDLWAAVLLSAGIYDLLRFHLSTVGRAWLHEFGDPEDPADAAYLRSYSPIHNVRSDVAYPPALISVGVRDERVAAWHSFKLAAALRAAAAPGESSAYLLVDMGAGHGFGARPDELTVEIGDLLAFAAQHGGLALPDPPWPDPGRATVTDAVRLREQPRLHDGSDGES